LASKQNHDEARLIQASRVVLRTGLLSLTSGTGSYRVKESMRRIAQAIGIEQHHAHVTLTEITSTSHYHKLFRTEVAETRAVGVNAARLKSLQDLADRLQRASGPADIDEVAAALDHIQRQPPLHRATLNALSAGLACACLSFLIGGGPIEIASALTGATAGQYLRRALVHRRFNQLGVTMLAAALASMVYLATAAGLDAALGNGPSQGGYVAAVLFLIPGFPLVTAGLDLARLDLSAGISRLGYAVMLTLAAGLVVWAVSLLVHLTPSDLHPFDLPPDLVRGLRLLASFVGAASFALMFNGTWKIAGLAGTCCSIANPLRLELHDLGVLPQVAAAAAALAVGLLSGLFAAPLRVPRITLSVPAVLPMIPGTLIYQAIYDFSQGDTAGTFGTLAQVIVSTAALPFGIILARMLTDRAWAFDDNSDDPVRRRPDHGSQRPAGP
jgi:uncharacterized membrane protein YjjP (DUF1212 family)